jgi:hypothetical protein
MPQPEEDNVQLVHLQTEKLQWNQDHSLQVRQQTQPKSTIRYMEGWLHITVRMHV